MKLIECTSHSFHKCVSCGAKIVPDDKCWMHYPDFYCDSCGIELSERSPRDVDYNGNPKLGFDLHIGGE